MKYSPALPLFPVLGAACLAFAIPIASADEVIWTAASNGNWSTGTNWSTTPNPPANAGSDVVNFYFTSAGALVTGMDANWSVEGIIAAATPGVSSVSTVTIVAGALSGGEPVMGVSGTLSIGESGLYVAPEGTGQSNLYLGDPTSGSTNHLTLNVTGDQSWQTSSTPTGGQIVVNADLAGSGEIIVQSRLQATNTTTGALMFSSGNSDAFTGSFVLRGGRLVLDGSSQIGRLGPNALTIENANTGSNLSNSELALQGLTDATQTFANAIHFVDAGTGKTNTINISFPAATAEELNWSGDWSGDMKTQLIMRQASRTMIQRIQGDNSSLTSTLTTGAINLKSGRYVLESNNALGAGNALSVTMGGENMTAAHHFSSGVAALYAVDGVTVNSNIDTPVGNTWGPVYEFGILESGTATYTGNIRVSNGTVATGGSLNMHLVAAPGGRANFTGRIEPGQLTGAGKVPVIVEGGGTVALSGSNSYHGETSVIEGTTLLANSAVGSSTGGTTNNNGAAAVYVGFGAANFTGNTTVNSTTVWGLGSTAGLHAGMKVTGAGIPNGAFITWVGTGQIGISELATATASGISISGAAETGILGGTGIVRPGVGGFVSVADASGISPGDGGIGNLKLDGANTTAALLTMASGAYFTFELGAGDTADKVSFWNYASGDFVLNNNVINFTSAQEGTYTLFDFYSNAGTTLTASGITSGLVLGTGLEGYTATLHYNANTITLDLVAVPEPSVVALLAAGSVTLLLRRRRA